MKYKLMPKLGFAASRGIEPHVQDLHDRDGYTVTCIAEVGGAMNEVVRLPGAGEDAVRLQILTLEPASDANAERLRMVARALRAMRNPQGELFGDMDAVLAADTVKSFGDMVGYEEAARVILGVQKYVAMLDKILARSQAAVKIDELWDTASVVLMGLQAVLDGARLPDSPDLGDDGQLDLRTGTGLVTGQSGSGKTDNDLIAEAERALRDEDANEAGYDGPTSPDLPPAHPGYVEPNTEIVLHAFGDTDETACGIHLADQQGLQIADDFASVTCLGCLAALDAQS